MRRNFAKNWLLLVGITFVVTITVSSFVTANRYKDFDTEFTVDTIFLSSKLVTNRTSYKMKDSVKQENGKDWFSESWIDVRGNFDQRIFDSLNAIDHKVHYDTILVFKHNKDNKIELRDDDDDLYTVDSNVLLLPTNMCKPFILVYRECYIGDEWVTSFSIPNKQYWRILRVPEHYELTEEFSNLFKKPENYDFDINPLEKGKDALDQDEKIAQ